MRILMAEDDLHVARYVKIGLEAEHFAVDLVADGLEAQNLAIQNDYDILILDIELAGELDGFQVLRFVRVKKPCVPVIILSGQSSTEARVR